MIAAGLAHAEPAPAVWDEPDPAAVVGRWRGAAVWRRCAAAGLARVVLDVRRDGSGYGVDLAPALDGLGAVVLVPAAARRLAAMQDDLAVNWTTGKHNRATLEVGFASGCTGTLRLTRDGSGAPACDELAALESIARDCPGGITSGLTDADRTVIARASRAGRGRSAAIRTCARHAPPLRNALLEAGCVPAPVEIGGPGVRVAECDALVATVSKLMRCDRVPADVKQRLHAGMQRVSRWATVAPGDDAEENRTRAAATCELARVDLVETMTILGCTP